MSEVKDYREPWRVNEDDAILKSDNSFAYSDDDRARIVATVNACAGLTAAQLANVRKAIKVLEMIQFEIKHTTSDFTPELNALIDAEEA